MIAITTNRGERGVSGGDMSEGTVIQTVPDELPKASVVQGAKEGRWATALKVEGAQFRRLTEVAEMDLQEGERQGCVFDTVLSDPNQGTGGFYVPLRELGSRTYEESRVERKQKLDRDRVMEQLARQKSWDMRETGDIEAKKEAKEGQEEVAEVCDGCRQA